MNNIQIAALNEELSKNKLKFLYYSELRTNKHGWHDKLYQFLSVVNPVYAVIAAFPIDKLDKKDESLVLEFNKKWVSHCYDNEWTGGKLSTYSAEKFLFALDVMYGKGMTNAGYCPTIDTKDIRLALRIIEFCNSSVFVDNLTPENYFVEISKVVKEGIKRYKKKLNENPDEANAAAISALDQYEKELNERIQREKREAELAEKFRIEQERFIKNKSIRAALYPLAISVSEFMNAFNWKGAAEELMKLVGEFNRLFADCPIKKSVTFSEREKTYPKNRIERKDLHIISVYYNKKLLHLNCKTGEFLFNNGFVHVYTREIDGRIFLYFSKNQIENAETPELRKDKSVSSYNVFSSAIIKKLSEHFNCSTNAVIEISDNISKTEYIRKFEVLRYEQR